MNEVVPFRAEHLPATKAQWLTAEQARLLEGMPGFTCLVDGKPALCAGAMPLWNGRLVVWATKSDAADGHWKSIHRAAKDFIASLRVRRIEAQVVYGDDAGCRWIERLGFTVEAPLLKNFFPDGQDGIGYVLTRGGQ